MLDQLSHLPADPLWGLTTDFRNDPRAEKIDLIVGVYRDETGVTPVMDVVHRAECALADARISKAYRSLAGNADFNQEMARLLLGNDADLPGRQLTMQTVGGTGALRLLAEFIARANPRATVWSTDPAYVNHAPIFKTAGLNVAPYRWHLDNKTVDLDKIMSDLNRANAGDIVLLHGCCHNPTGLDMPLEGWQSIADICLRKNLIPMIDHAYLGLGHGLDADIAGLRLLITQVETVLVAASCSKSMGLYCERTGTATVVTGSPSYLKRIKAHLEGLTRVNYSMPPEHGAAIAARVLKERDAWVGELEDMRQRINGLRVLLADELSRLGAPHDMLALRHHVGMFSTLPFDEAQMGALRQQHAIYGTDGGRINIAGLTPLQIPSVATALVDISRAKTVQTNRHCVSLRSA